MSVRFFCHSLPETSCEVALPKEIAHHICVRRLRVESTIELFDGQGRSIQATIVHIERRTVMVRTNQHIQQVDDQSPLNITLAQCLSGSDNMDWTIEKAVELGVHGIQPLQGIRSVAKLDESRALKKTQHWQSIIQSACEQSGRYFMPNLQTWQNSLHWLQQTDFNNTYDTAWILHPRNNTSFSKINLSTNKNSLSPLKIVIFIGPEAGFSEEELFTADKVGLQAVGLGPRILRTETAGLALIASLQAKFGDF